MLHINRNIAIDRDEIKEEFIRASGPGGQNVNKVATAVQLHFDVAGSPSLPDEVRQRLLRIARTRITEDGILVIEAKRFRSQRANRRDALERLVELIRSAARKPRIRKKTGPTKASKERRLESKKRRTATKRLRRPVDVSADQ
jgi:ribosome-associated protein